MIERAKHNLCISSFDLMGFHKYKHAKEKTIVWSSSAYKNQEFSFLDAEGRLFVDLLPLIRRDFKFDNYKLSTVSDIFIGDNKKDLPPKGIFKCYRQGTVREPDGTFGEKAIKAMSKCGAYCVQDSVLVIKLMDKLQTWVGLTEMACTFNTQIFTLYTQGQQIKVYSQVYKYCTFHNIVVEKDGYITKDSDRYVGAHVFPPVPGVYDRVVPFDFCFSGETLITLSNGTSKKIKEMINDHLVIGFDDKGLKNFSSINGLQRKGLKNTIKVFLQDGKIIKCTPEHKIMLDDGTWCEAKDLKNKYIKCGIEYPEDIKYEEENEWTLEVEGYIFNMKTNEEREKSLAFSRILGYILSDGSIYHSICERSLKGYRECSEACFGTLVDCENFKIDLFKISDVDVKIRKRIREDSKKGTSYSITLPTKISKMIHSLEDIVTGKRCTNQMKLPKFILKNDCPLSIIKQFLGGLYGGDGTAPYITNRNSFGPVSFKWTIIEKYLESMVNVFEQLKILHSKLGIDITIYKPKLVKYKENSIKP